MNELIKCPRCSHSAWLYKEIYPDGKSQIKCFKVDCGWIGDKVEHHIDLPTLIEKKRDWQ